LNPNLPNLLLDPFFTKKILNAELGWRRTVSIAVLNGLAVPALSTALCYFDGIRSARSPHNLIQAQRDYFGAHTYERVDKPGWHHTNWTGHGGNTTSSVYNQTAKL